MQYDLTLEPGEEWAGGYTAACSDSGKNAAAVISNAGEERCGAKLYSAFVLKSPDGYVDTLTNIWLKRQVSLGKTWGRIYGKGFRDVMQDTAGFVSLDPAAARKRYSML